MANRRYIDFPIASSVGDSDIILIWQSGANKQTTKATFLSGLPTDLEDLNDVAISGLTNGQILRYDSVTGKWENTDQGNLDLNDLNDVSIVSPSNGQVLVYNSSTSKWENSSGGYVPYTGAVTTVNLGAQTIQAGSFVKAGGTAAQFLKANGSVDSNVYGTGTVTSVALTMPSAFSVANSPVTTAGTLAVTGAGTVGQYIRGDGSLADFPESSGGGSSVSYYLNGSVAQGTIGGVAYKELNKVPILGAGTDFTINADGYIASFITDAGDPNLLEIPSGNWNFETYFSASSNGGSPRFYVELYKVNSGGTATLIASNSTFPELIAFGTNVISYFSTLAVPTTALALTDRLAIRYYVIHSGRTITLHTEDNHLCQIITTFTTGITALNGLTAQVQNFAVGTSGTDFAIASATATHTFNLPTASAINRGALSSSDWTTFNNKTSNLGTVTSVGLSSATSGVTIGSTPVTTSGTITLAIATASGSQNGLLSSTDWTTFNNKAPSVAGGYLPLSGGALTGPLTSSSNAIFKTTSGFALKLDSSSLSEDNDLRFAKGGVDFGAIQTNGTTGDFEFYVNIDGTSGGYYQSIILKRDSTKIDFLISNAINTTINSSGLTSSAFIKTGGTSAQFLKADGSVDSTAYGTGTVTSVTASSPLASSGGTTPNITIQQASGSQSGFLSSTDWTTFNSKQNALTNPVTGTGSAGQVAYWSSASAITGESNLFWDSTNDRLGIGFSNPSQPLEVSKSQNADTAIQVTNLNSGVSATAQFFADNGTTRTQFFHTGTNYGTLGVIEANQGGIYNLTSAGIALVAAGASGILRFATGGTTTRLTISSTGAATFSNDVTVHSGLGTSVLNIGGTNGDYASAINFIGNNTFKNWQVGSNTGVQGSLEIRSSTVAGGTSFTTPVFSLSSTGAATFSSSVTTRNATTSASVNPSVMGAGEMMSTGSQAGYFWENRSGGVTSNSNWYGWYNASGINHLYNGSSNLISINGSNGNFGIGDSNPLQKLIVNGGSLLVNSGTSASAFRDIMMGGIGGWSSGESHGIDTVYNTAASPITFSRIESHFDGTSGRIRFRNLFFSSSPRTDILMTIEGNGNVLIGNTTDNGSKLQVSGQTTLSGITGINSSPVSGVVLSIKTENNGSIDFGLVIRNSSDTNLFRVRNDGSVILSSLGTGLVYSNGGILTSTNPSDFNLKENITPINYGLSQILQLNAVTFNWKNDKINQGKQYGFIAQEVQKIMPDLVKKGEYLGLDKEGIFTTLVKAIQELKQEIDTLKN